MATSLPPPAAPATPTVALPVRLSSLAPRLKKKTAVSTTSSPVSTVHRRKHPSAQKASVSSLPAYNELFTGAPPPPSSSGGGDLDNSDQTKAAAKDDNIAAVAANSSPEPLWEDPDETLDRLLLRSSAALATAQALLSGTLTARGAVAAVGQGARDGEDVLARIETETRCRAQRDLSLMPLLGEMAMLVAELERPTSVAGHALRPRLLAASSGSGASLVGAVSRVEAITTPISPNVVSSFSSSTLPPSHPPPFVSSPLGGGPVGRRDSAGDPSPMNPPWPSSLACDQLRASLHSRSDSHASTQSFSSVSSGSPSHSSPLPPPPPPHPFTGAHRRSPSSRGLPTASTSTPSTAPSTLTFWRGAMPEQIEEEEDSASSSSSSALSPPMPVLENRRGSWSARLGGAVERVLPPTWAASAPAPAVVAASAVFATDSDNQEILRVSSALDDFDATVSTRSSARSRGPPSSPHWLDGSPPLSASSSRTSSPSNTGPRTPSHLQHHSRRSSLARPASSLFLTPPTSITTTAPPSPSAVLLSTTNKVPGPAQTKSVLGSAVLSPSSEAMARLRSLGGSTPASLQGTAAFLPSTPSPLSSIASGPPAAPPTTKSGWTGGWFAGGS